MKFNRIVRTTLAAGMSLAVGLGATACSRDYTAAYVYAPSASNGTISGFAVDYQTGILTQLPGSPFSSQLTNPSTIVASPGGKFLYVIGGSQNAEVEEYALGTDGKIYGEKTYNITGTYPTAATIDPTGSFLYVTYTYQNGYTPASPGPGGVTLFKINADGTLATPSNINVGNNPAAIAVAADTCTTTPLISTNTKCSTGTENVFVYVVDDENSSFSPGAVPTVLGFAEDTTSGNLSLLSATAYNSTLKTYQNTQGIGAGVTPSAIAVDPTGRFAYVTDKTSNEIYGYAVASTTSGNLTPLVSSPYPTGLYPVSITIDPRGKYLYTANYNSSTVSGFALSQANGSLGGASGAGNFTTYTGPTCVTIEPALGIYLFTSNYLNGSITAAKLSPDTGQLTGVPDNPFTTSPLPSCLVAVANGAHSIQLVNP